MSLVDKLVIGAAVLFSTSVHANDSYMQEYLTKNQPKAEIEYAAQDSDKKTAEKPNNKLFVLSVLETRGFVDAGDVAVLYSALARDENYSSAFSSDQLFDLSVLEKQNIVDAGDVAVLYSTLARDENYRTLFE